MLGHAAVTPASSDLPPPGRRAPAVAGITLAELAPRLAVGLAQPAAIAAQQLVAIELLGLAVLDLGSALRQATLDGAPLLRRLRRPLTALLLPDEFDQRLGLLEHLAHGLRPFGADQ